jgi:hypothetical protein
VLDYFVLIMLEPWKGGVEKNSTGILFAHVPKPKFLHGGRAG